VDQEYGIRIRPELVLQLEGMESTPELGYPYGKALIGRNIPFTALFAYNDISALGAMRAFQEAGLKTPEDVSVIGFDDISIASFSIPPLTTVRQPLLKMGSMAAQILIDRIEERGVFSEEVAIEPQLIVRRSTGVPRQT
jgi:DNA-binding LacI/PurR family transcriptional regulator